MPEESHPRSFCQWSWLLATNANASGLSVLSVDIQRFCVTICGQPKEGGRMTQQFVFTLTAAAIGFAASIFLFIGSISQSPKQMVIDTKPFWEFNPQALRSMAFKKAHSLIGGFMLAISFFLQI